MHEIERIWKEEEEEEGEKGSVTFKQSVDSWEDLGSDQEQQVCMCVCMHTCGV